MAVVFQCHGQSSCSIPQWMAFRWFSLLSYHEECCWEHCRTSLWERSGFWSRFLGAKCCILWYAFGETASCSPEWLQRFPLPTRKQYGSRVSTSFLADTCCWGAGWVVLLREVCGVTLSFRMHFLNDNDSGHLFVCSLALLYLLWWSGHRYFAHW